MSYDFAVLLPEHGRPVAPQVYRAMCDEILTPAPPAVDAFVAEVNTSFGVEVDDRDIGFLTVETSADARGAVLCTAWQSFPHAGQTLIDLAFDHGLLLYDPQRDRLYDPRGGIGIAVSLGGQVTVPYVTQNLIAEYFACPEPDGPFLIMDRDDDVYVQAYVNDDGVIDVECRMGGPEQHYATRTSDWGLAQKLLWGWASGDDDWSAAAEWERLEF